ncbi:MAG: T9SS type A sorting domain-containing protein [Algicola sp.]|nr:T9SS type A sorting domain-containing protein [Algicola sp.]
MKRFCLAFLLALLISPIALSQTTLYSENFTGQNGKGASGNNLDVSGVNWSIDVSEADLDSSGNSFDYFYVTDEAFAAKDTDGNVIWYSPSINITGYVNVSFTLDAYTSGHNDNNDSLSAQYRIDGGTWITAENNGNLTNDFNLVVSQTELSGDTLEIRIQIENDKNNEVTTFDNIWVVGDVATTEPITYTFEDGVWSPSNPNNTTNSIDTLNIVTGDAVIESNIICNSATVNAGASLTINSEATLTTNDLTLKSNSTRFSSLILNGNIIGNVNYERHVNVQAGGNDLISAPVTGQTFGSFAAANPNIFSNPSNPSQKLFGPWDKANASYLIYDTDNPADANVILQPGKGYRTASADNSTFTFTGTVNKDAVNIDIVNSGPLQPFEQEWNLVGNPYPSYINVHDFLLHEVGEDVTNLQLFATKTAAIYGYDGNAADDWTIYNLATTTPSTVIAPGQGFFVSANIDLTDTYDLEFTPTMRSTGSSDDFILGRNAQLTYLKLNLSSGNKVSKTDVYFNPNASLGFDLGYDAAVWGGTASNFSIYSNLVEDNIGDALALQALAYNDMTDVTIPLGVHANQGEQITFSISDSTLPDTISVYLEDTLLNTTTLLNTSDYVITPSTPISGTGRFFLRTSEDVLSTFENSYDQLNVKALNKSKEIVVNGYLKDTNVLNLYDIQGKLILSHILDHAVQQNRIDVSSLQAGMYVVNIQSNSQQITQKVIIN